MMDSAGHIPILDVTFVKTPSMYKKSYCMEFLFIALLIRMVIPFIYHNTLIENL